MCPVIFQQTPGVDNLDVSIRQFVTAVAEPAVVRTTLPGRRGSLEIVLGRMLSASHTLSTRIPVLLQVSAVAITLGEVTEATPTDIEQSLTTQWPMDCKLTDGRSLLEILTSQYGFTADGTRRS